MDYEGQMGTDYPRSKLYTYTRSVKLSEHAIEKSTNWKFAVNEKNQRIHS